MLVCQKCALPSVARSHCQQRPNAIPRLTPLTPPIAISSSTHPARSFHPHLQFSLHLAPSTPPLRLQFRKAQYYLSLFAMSWDNSAVVADGVFPSPHALGVQPIQRIQQRPVLCLPISLTPFNGRLLLHSANLLNLPQLGRPLRLNHQKTSTRPPTTPLAPALALDPALDPWTGMLMRAELAEIANATSKLCCITAAVELC